MLSGPAQHIGNHIQNKQSSGKRIVAMFINFKVDIFLSNVLRKGGDIMKKALVFMCVAAIVATCAPLFAAISTSTSCTGKVDVTQVVQFGIYTTVGEGGTFYLGEATAGYGSGYNQFSINMINSNQQPCTVKMRVSGPYTHTSDSTAKIEGTYTGTSGTAARVYTRVNEFDTDTKSKVNGTLGSGSKDGSNNYYLGNADDTYGRCETAGKDYTVYRQATAGTDPAYGSNVDFIEFIQNTANTQKAGSYTRTLTFSIVAG